MNKEPDSVEINFVDGHADVWRLFDDEERLREIAKTVVDPFRGDVTKVAGSNLTASSSAQRRHLL